MYDECVAQVQALVKSSAHVWGPLSRPHPAQSQADIRARVDALELATASRARVTIAKSPARAVPPSSTKAFAEVWVQRSDLNETDKAS
jgi:hypothetical protein